MRREHATQWTSQSPENAKLVGDILLVEDAEGDARLIQRTLQIAGVRNPLRHISSGTEAMAYLAEAENGAKTVPAVLLVDVKLPGMSGFEILAWTRGRAAFLKMLRIVLSSLDDIPSIRKAYTLGANSFLIKPPRQQEFEELIKTFPANWILSSEGI